MEEKRVRGAKRNRWMRWSDVTGENTSNLVRLFFNFVIPIYDPQLFILTDVL